MQPKNHIASGVNALTSVILTDVFYVVKQNMEISSACVNRRPYFGNITKNMLKNDFKTREHRCAKMLTHFQSLGLIPALLYKLQDCAHINFIILLVLRSH